MRRLYVSKFVNLGLVLLVATAIVGYTWAADAPSTFASTQIRSWLDPHPSQATALQTSNQLVVIAFSDTTGAGGLGCPGCDMMYSSSDEAANSNNPLPPMEFVVHNARTGQELGRQLAEQQPQGRYRAVFQLPANLQDNIILSLASGPAGFQLCPNAPLSRTISLSDFILGTHEEVYAFWTGCPVQGNQPTTGLLQVSPTPEPPTTVPQAPGATPVPTTEPLPERNVVVEAFTDVTGPGGLQCPGCDRIFSSSDQVANASDPLPNMEFILREASTGRLLARQTTTLDAQGRARTLFQIPAGFDQTVTVELASDPGGFQLCPNVSRTRTILPNDFILGTHLEQFPFWKGCAVAAPTTIPGISPSPTPIFGGAVIAVVTARGLNVRAGPGVNYQRLGAVVGGTQITLTGRNASATWVRGLAIATGLEGWYSAGFLRIEGNVMTLPVVAEDTPGVVVVTPVPGVVLPVPSLNAVVTARGLNVRAGPGVKFIRLGAVASGTTVTLIGRDASGTWVRGSVPGTTLEGWLSAGFLRVDGDVNALPVLSTTGGVVAPSIIPIATPTIPGLFIPDKMPQTGGFGIPLWGLFTMAAAILLALSHAVRWVRRSAAD